MKQIILFLTIFLPWCLQAQIRESFDGPEITTQNLWQGDLEEFIINSSGWLECVSIPDEAGSLSLYLPVTYHPSMTWSMDVSLWFKPTNANNARIYVYSTDEKGDDTLYYIQVGNNNGQVSFYSFTNNKATLRIAGRGIFTTDEYKTVAIRLTLEENKEWTLYTRCAGESEYYREGSYNRTLQDIKSGGFFHISCRYVKSRMSIFEFDNIVISPYPAELPGGEDKPDPETPLPELKDIEIMELDQLKFIFSGEVLADEATFKISGIGEATKVEYADGKNSLIVLFPDKMIPGNEYTISFSGLKSASGRTMPDESWGVELEEHEIKDPDGPGDENGDNEGGDDGEEKGPETGDENKEPGGNEGGDEEKPVCNVRPYEYGSVRLNEVMADPKGLQVIPETEYIELYNASGEEVCLKDWTLYYGNQAVTLEPFLLPAAGYLVLYRKPRDIWLQDGGYSMALPKFPAALANTGKQLILYDGTGQLMDEVYYEKATSGRSWERDEEDSWYLSLDSRGGTPGAANSKKPDEIIPPPDVEGEVNAGEIVFNELLPDPYEGGSEYVELYNRSGKALPVVGLSIAVRKTDGSLQTPYPLHGLPVMEEEGYLVITKDRDGVLSYYSTLYPEVIHEMKMPVLANTSSTLVLFRTEDGEVIDEVSYHVKWHSYSINKTKGIALERINPEGDTQDENNWTSGAQTVGYGTPGYRNSQFMQEENPPPGIDKPGYNEDGTYSIPYQLDKAGYHCRGYVYSLSGSRLAEVVNHAVTGTSGMIEWDGTTANGRLIRTGLYILYLDFYHPEGDTKQYKLPVVVR